MVYMLEVFVLVSIPIFLVAGAVLLTLIACATLKDYVRARVAMRRIVAAAKREALRISPLNAQGPSAESLRVA